MIIIIGRIPPPIGGVTIYVSRLIEHMTKSGAKFCFVNLNLKNLFLINKLLKGQIIHLIASHPFIRLYYGVICKILKKKLIIIYTDNIGEFSNSFYNMMNTFSIQLATIPAVLNRDSLEIALKINTNTKLVSSFIPPNNDESNFHNLKNYLIDFLSNKKIIFCTNAFDYCIDKDGNELYGIISLIGIFNQINDYGLIIADPSGGYLRYIQNNNIEVKSNIRILSESKFSFIDVIKISDCLIRATTTDGDSLSIHEGLYLNKDVICSDCTSRPIDCIIFENQNFKALNDIIINYIPSLKIIDNINKNNGFSDILEIYKQLINSN